MIGHNLYTLPKHTVSLTVSFARKRFTIKGVLMPLATFLNYAIKFYSLSLTSFTVIVAVLIHGKSS